MKHIGELVVYGTNGVCQIEDLREENFSGVARQYYILRPIADQGNNRIFVPTDNEKLVGEMKNILQPAELYATVQKAKPYDEAEWPKDGRLRSKLCREILSSCDREQLLRLVKTVKGKGGNPSSSEESTCRRVSLMLYQEFSLVLDLEKEDVIPFIMGELLPPPKSS